LKEIFRFTKSERIASLIILGLTLAVLLLLALVRRVRPLSEEDARLFDSLVPTLLAGEDTLSQPLPQKRRKGSSRDTAPLILPVRDPNRMTKEEWERLPLPSYVVRTILHYRERGGIFRKKEDLKKIYGMTDSLYEAVAPFLRVEERVPAQRGLSGHRSDSGRVPEEVPRTPAKIDINRADSAAFDSLPGITPWLARRIVRYRALLGGFVRKEQLLEVYGLDSLTYRKIRDRLTSDTSAIRRINVNRCDERALAHHPYLSEQEAGAVIFYREHFGKIQELKVLLKQHVLPENTFRRIRPYLKTAEEK